jgi:hypothetical protein
MEGPSDFGEIERTVGDSEHPSGELSRDLGRFFGVSADKMTQGMIEYQVVCFESVELLFTRFYIL